MNKQRRFDPLPKGPTSPDGQLQSTENQTFTKTGKSTGAPENQNLVSGLFFESEIDTSELGFLQDCEHRRIC